MLIWNLNKFYLAAYGKRSFAGKYYYSQQSWANNRKTHVKPSASYTLSLDKPLVMDLWSHFYCDSKSRIVWTHDQERYTINNADTWQRFASMVPNGNWRIAEYTPRSHKPYIWNSMHFFIVTMREGTHFYSYYRYVCIWFAIIEVFRIVIIYTTAQVTS